MKTITLETLDTEENFNLEICKGTTPLDILEALGIDRYQVGRKVDGEEFRTFGEGEDIYEEVTDQDELILLPKADIDPPFHPEKKIKIVKAENGRVHQISIRQGDKLEQILERLDLESGVLYKQHAPKSTFTNLTEPFEDVQQGETLTYFGPSAFPTLLKNLLRGGDPI